MDPAPHPSAAYPYNHDDRGASSRRPDVVSEGLSGAPGFLEAAGEAAAANSIQWWAAIFKHMAGDKKGID